MDTIHRIMYQGWTTEHGRNADRDLRRYFFASACSRRDCHSSSRRPISR